MVVNNNTSVHCTKKKIYIIIVGSILIIIAALWTIWYWEIPLRQRLKDKVTSQVIQYEDVLNQCVQEYENKEIPRFLGDFVRGDEYSYKQLNNENINKVFNKFNILYIHDKSYDDKDKKLVFYMTSPVTYILWKRYEYGFYFSEEDKALNIVWGVEECKSGTEIRGKYWAGTTIYYVYRTEKITDNWCFFEYKQWGYQ